MNRERSAGRRGRQNVLAQPWPRAVLRGACLGLTCLGLAWPVTAGAAGFEVHPDAAVQDAGRKTVTLSYRIRNVGPGRGEVTPRVTLPPGWRLLIPPARVTLDPGEEAGGLLVVLPAEGAAAGEYTVTLEDDEGHRAEVRVRVAPQPLLAAAVAGVPSVVVGEPYTAVFTVGNAGNVAQAVSFTATNSAALAQEVSPARATLAPGERATVRVRVLVPPDLASAQTVFVQLQARGGALSGGQVAAEVSASTEVLPGRVPLSATHVTLPLTVALSAESGGAAWRVAGATRLPGDTRVTLDLGSSGGLAGLERGPLSLSLGDQRYGQAPQEGDSPAPGLRAVYRGATWSAEGNVSSPGGGGPLAFGVGAAWRPTPGSALAGDLYREEDAWRWAAHAGAANSAGGAWWSTGMNAGGTPGGDWKAGAGAAFGVRGAQGLITLGREVKGGEGAWQIGAAGSWWRAPFTLGLSAAYGTAPGRPQPWAEVGATLGYGWAGGSASFHYVYRSAPAGEAGEEAPGRHRAQLLAETLLPLHTTHELLLDADPGARLGYEGGLDLPTGAGTFSTAASAHYDFGARAGTLGARVGWEKIMGGTTTLNLGLGTDDLRAGLWTVKGGAARSFVGGGQVGGSAGLRLGAAGVGGVTWKLAATWPVEVPLAPRRDVGSLSGRVTDESGAGVAGLLLRLGALAARTDARGVYTFPAVPLGTHYLTADAAGLGPDRLALPALPARVEVRAPGALTRHLRLVRPAAVLGELRLVDAPVRFGELDGNPTAGVLLELRGEGGGVLRALTDEGGRFAFTGLAPGTWTLSLAGGPLGRESPRLAGYVPQIASTPLTLTSGSRVTVTLALTARSRTLNVQNGGSLTPLLPPVPGGPPK